MEAFGPWEYKLTILLVGDKVPQKAPRGHHNGGVQLAGRQACPRGGYLGSGLVGEV